MQSRLVGMTKHHSLNLSCNHFLSEENYEPLNEAETRDYILMGVRCLVVSVFLLAFVLFLVLVLRGRRLKNWRLYALCGLIYFAWLGMSLYFVSLVPYFTCSLVN